jgi:hypothetical protein
MKCAVKPLIAVVMGKGFRTEKGIFFLYGLSHSLNVQVGFISVALWLTGCFLPDRTP